MTHVPSSCGCAGRRAAAASAPAVEGSAAGRSAAPRRTGRCAPLIAFSRPSRGAAMRALWRGLGRGAALGLALAMTAVAPAPASAAEVTVFAAASLKNAMDEIGAAFQAQTGDALSVSLAGSSALARQIQAGAPADVFISANQEWMDAIQADGLVDQASRVDLLRNTLVLVEHAGDAAAAPVGTIGAAYDLPARLGENRLAMALVEAVPAGIYGKAALTHLGWWEALAPKVAQADNVRAALALVSTGEAPYGIVYATDAVAAGDKVRVAGTFPEDSHPPIIYPAARIAGHDDPAVDRFLAFLRGPEARAAFERQGFEMLPASKAPGAGG